jgi:CHAD domain-containing protein
MPGRKRSAEQDERGPVALRMYLGQAMRDQARVVRERHRAVLEAVDPEAVHDLRVALRRLRVWGRLLPRAPDQDALRPTDDQERESGWLWDRLGAVRDLEVQQALVEGLVSRKKKRSGGKAAEAINRELARRHRARKLGLMATLRSGRVRDLVEGLADRLDAPPEPVKGRMLTAAAEEAVPAVRRRLKRVRRLGDTITECSPPEQLHRLRLRTKRLRYAAELVEDLQPGRLDGLVDAAARLQDLLGQQHDWIVVAGYLTDAGRRAREAGDESAAEAAGRLAGAAEAEAGKCRAAFPGRYRPLVRAGRRSLRAR